MNSKLSIIAAIGKNRELGKDNKLIWKIPEDMAWFREKTTGHPVIMGRKTYDSIGRYLPNRVNIVITRDPQFHAENVTVARSLEEAIAIGKATNVEEIFVIGGASIYQQALPLTDKLYITLVDAQDFNADTFFPEYTTRFTKELSSKTIQSSSGYMVTWKILVP